MYKYMLFLINVSLCGSAVVHEPYKIHTSHRIAHSGSIQDSVVLGTLDSRHLHESDKYGNTPLHYAAYYNSKKNVDTLIDYGADINACNVFKETPLFLAVRKDHQQVIISLVSQGAKICVKNSLGKCLCSLSSANQMEIMYAAESVFLADQLLLKGV